MNQTGQKKQRLLMHFNQSILFWFTFQLNLADEYVFPQILLYLSIKHFFVPFNFRSQDQKHVH